MKNVKFLVIIVLLSLGAVLYQNYIKSDLSRFIVRKSLPFTFDSTSLSQDYGVDPRGVFFVHERMFGGLTATEGIVLVVLPEKTEYSDSRVKETGEKYYYRMVKVGDYYVARTKKTFSPSFFYFKSGAICFPTVNQEKFSSADLLQNYHGGYVLRSN